MNTMKILIGATFAVLVACLFLSYNKMKTDLDRDPSVSEIAALQKRLTQLENADKGTYPTHNAPTTNTPYNPTPSIQPTANPLEQQAAEMAKQKEIEELRKKLAESEAKTEKAEHDADIADAEAGALAEEVLDQRQPEIRKAKSIVNALLMARVSSYDVDNQLVGIQVERQEQVHPGITLGIRRNSGIIGRIKISTVEFSEAVGDPIKGSFMGGNIDIREGDELILPPVY